MKRMIMAAVMLLFCASTSCASERLVVLTTIFPAYDWTKNIVGDLSADVEVEMLAGGGVDLHSWSPSAEDVLKIARSGLFICVGGESEAWVDDVMKNTGGGPRVVKLLDAIGDAAKEEEIVPGMQDEDEHEHEHEDEHEHETELDEHVWLSLRNAASLCRVIEGALCELDPKNAARYSENAASYIKQLEALDARYERAISGAPIKTLIFADRFPFRYLADDYGLEYSAAFRGCSAESEASFETIAFLARRVDDLGLDRVITIEGGDGRIAEAVIAATKARDARALVLDSMQTVAPDVAEGGYSYISAMERDLAVIEEALGARDVR